MGRIVNIDRLTIVGTPESCPERIRELLGDGSASVNIESLTVITADDDQLVAAITQALSSKGEITL